MASQIFRRIGCHSPLSKLRTAGYHPFATRCSNLGLRSSTTRSFSIFQPPRIVSRNSIPFLRQTKPEFPRNADLDEDLYTFTKSMSKAQILRPTLFVLFVSGFVYLSATMATGSDTDYWIDMLSEHPQHARFPAGSLSLSEVLLVYRAQQKADEAGRKLKQWATELKSAASTTPFHLFYGEARRQWIMSNEAKQTAYKVVALNLLVFLAWKVPTMTRFMRRHFIHSSFSGRSYTLLTSCFSHKDLWHLGFNMLALTSFAPSVYRSLFTRTDDPEMTHSTPVYHMIAFMITAGLMSSWAGHMYKTLVEVPRALKAISNPALTQAQLLKQLPAMGSLGASGILYSMLTLTALSIPQAEVSIMFVFPGIPILPATCGLVAFDMLSLYKNWRIFDHAAHLGGAAFGAWYYAVGIDWWNDLVKTDREVRKEAHAKNQNQELE